MNKQNELPAFRIKKVIKRDGTIEAFDPEKLNGWGKWACGKSGASWSSLILRAIKQVSDEVVTTDFLQSLLITTAQTLLDEDPAYDIVARELMIAQDRKNLFDSYYPPSLQSFHDRMVDLKAWSDKRRWLTKEDIAYLSSLIDHSRDHLFTGAGYKQFKDKYSRRNIHTGEIYETPQFAYMGMVMEMLSQPHWDLEDATDLYDALSLHKINVPTPPLVGLRSTDRGFASCCLVDATDTLDSIDTAEHIVFKMTAARAGIGYHLESRSVADPVREGSFPHSGKMPYYAHIDRSVKGNTQQARGGSATVNVTFIDPEIITILKAKSQRTAEQSKLDKMDYSLVYNPLLFKRYQKGENLTLMSYLYAPEVYEALYAGNQAEFERVYVAAEERLKNKTKIGFKGERLPACPQIPAAEVLETFIAIRSETGRAYFIDINEVNRNSRFKDRVRMSNLCLEILQPTYPFYHVMDLYRTKEALEFLDDPEKLGEVSLCNLGGIALGRMNSLEEWEKYCYVLLKFVDTIIEIQDYAFPTMEYTAKARRNVGIGLMNAAGAMAAEGLAYEGVEARNWIHREAEKASFFLHTASVRLAAEIGPCKWFDRTTASEGKLVIDTYKKSVDELTTQELQFDWEQLRANIKKYGMRNSVLTANMPGESSSVLLGVTNSVEPPRAPVTVKASGVNKVVTLVPYINDWEVFSNYKYAFDIDRAEYIKWRAVLQKFTCQATSSNDYYDYNKFPKGIIPQKELIRDMMLATKYGIKTGYYANFDVDNGGASSSKCAGGGCML